MDENALTQTSVPVVVEPVIPTEPPSEASESKPRWERMPVERRVEIALMANSTDGVALGDVLFLDDGSANLGNTVFASGTAVNNHTWGPFVANRAAGAEQLLAIDRPDGETFYFCFQDEKWFRLVPFVRKQNILLHTLSERVRQYGWLPAIVHWVYELLRGAFFLLITAAICFGVLAALTWARS